MDVLVGFKERKSVLQVKAKAQPLYSRFILQRLH